VTRRLPLILGASVAALAFGSLSQTAEAGRGGIHFSGGVHYSSGFRGGWGGGVHVNAGVHVNTYAHWARPSYSWRPNHFHVRGHVWVGGYHPYYYRPYYSYYYPEYVPSYYGASYYPVQPTYAAPGVSTAVVAAEPELPRFGVGLFAGGVATDYNTQTNTQETDLGVLGRFRLTQGLLVEGELGKTSTTVNGVDNLRVDRRLGGSLVYEIGATNRWAPFVLAGLGVQQADVNGDYSTTQDYGELGAGIRFAVTPSFHLTLDVRAGTRSTVSNDQVMPAAGVARTVTPPTSDSGQSEDYTRARLSAILYF
jgi:Outer membrane protein beta-barrel domain